MSSNFSSTKAYCRSIWSTSQSLPGSASEASNSAKERSKTSRYSSRSSTKDSTKLSSKVSAKSSSKLPSKMSSKQSSKSSHKHKSKFTLFEISTNGQGHEGSTNLTYSPIGHYVTSPTYSNPYYNSSSTTMTQAQYKARMQALIEDIGLHLDLNDAQVDLYDDQIDSYDTQLDLSEDESEEH